MHGLTVAQKEYDRELVARRNAEAEVIRLRVLLSGQAAKLTALNGESNRQEARRQLSEELSKNLDQLEKDLSKLKVERDLTLAEVEELCTSKRFTPSLNGPYSHLLYLQLVQCLSFRRFADCAYQSVAYVAPRKPQVSVPTRTHSAHRTT